MILRPDLAHTVPGNTVVELTPDELAKVTPEESAISTVTVNYQDGSSETVPEPEVHNPPVSDEPVFTEEGA